MEIDIFETLLPYTYLLVIIIGWMHNERSTIEAEKRSAKIRAYENNLSVIWSLFTLASQKDLTDEMFYKEQGRSSDLELVATSEIITKTELILELISDLHKSPQKDTYFCQEKVLREYEMVVNLMRADLGLDLGAVFRSVATFDAK